MWPFSKSKAIEEPPPAETPEQQLAAVSREYREAEADFTKACFELAQHVTLHQARRSFMINDKMFVPVNAFAADPARIRLEGLRDEARRKRNELLAQRADLMTSMGTIR